MTAHLPPLLTEIEAARYLRISPRTRYARRSLQQSPELFPNRRKRSPKTQGKPPMTDDDTPAPKADALPGCATPRPAEARRFASDSAQVESAETGNAGQNMAGTGDTTPEIVPNQPTTPNHQAELLPCPTPWCDAVFGPPVLKEEQFSAYIYCPTCGVESRRKPSTLEAIAAWNKRLTSHETELVEALELWAERYRMVPEWRLRPYSDDQNFVKALIDTRAILAKAKAGAS